MKVIRTHKRDKKQQFLYAWKQREKKQAKHTQKLGEIFRKKIAKKNSIIFQTIKYKKYR